MDMVNHMARTMGNKFETTKNVAKGTGTQKINEKIFDISI